MACATEVPGVKSAVTKLQELGDRMDSEEFGFKENDVNNIDKIIDALQELEKERQNVHELLEVETIQASVLRHKLHFFPNAIQAQINAAIKSARDSNAELINSLTAELAAIHQEIKDLEEKQRQTEAENASLQPERDSVKETHEEIIQQLNARLSEKATKQILLNETRDKLRATNQKIVDIEDGIDNLKETMVQERADARMEKKKLKKAVFDTTIRVKNQREANIEKKRQLDELREKMLASENALDVIRKSIRRYDTSRSRMEGQERALTAQLNREMKHNQDLRQKGIEIEEENKKNQREFQARKKNLEETMKELDVTMDGEFKKNEMLEGKKMILEMDVVEAEEQKRKDKRKVDELKSMLQLEKEVLGRKAEDAGSLRQDNIDMTEEINTIGETHEISVAAMNKQVEEYREQLGKERKERMDMQQRRDDVQKNVDDFRSDNQKFMNKMNKKMTQGKLLHEKLTKEGEQLQREIRQGDQNIVTLTSNLATSKTTYEDMKTELETRISQLEEAVVHLAEGIEVKRSKLQERVPIFQELEKTYEEYMSTYDTKKKELITFKNKKFSLEDFVKRTKRDMDKLVGPKEKVTEGLKTKKDESMVQLKDHTSELIEIEKEIFQVGTKLKTVMGENYRFEMAIKKFENNIVELKRDMGDNERVKAILQAELDQIKVILNDGWADDHAIEEKFATRDQNIVNELDKLLNTTDKREKKVTKISDKLHEELELLASFLENVESRRPKESRQGSRTSVEGHSHESTKSPSKTIQSLVEAPPISQGEEPSTETVQDET